MRMSRPRPERTKLLRICNVPTSCRQRELRMPVPTVRRRDHRGPWMGKVFIEDSCIGCGNAEALPLA